MEKFQVVVSAQPIEQIDRLALVTVKADDHRSAAIAGLRLALRRGQVVSPGLAYAMVGRKIAANLHANGSPMLVHGFTLQLGGEADGPDDDGPPLGGRCAACGRQNRIVNECRCDPNNLPTRPAGAQ